MAKKGKKGGKRIETKALKASDAKGLAGMSATPSSDTSAVQDSYNEALKTLFDTFFRETITTDKQQAENEFVNGLAILRQTRDRALQLV